MTGAKRKKSKKKGKKAGEGEEVEEEEENSSDEEGGVRRKGERLRDKVGIVLALAPFMVEDGLKDIPVFLSILDVSCHLLPDCGC